VQTQVLEGTLAEILQQLGDLPYAPETWVRITIEAAEPETATKQTRNGITLVPVNKPEPASAAKPFRPTEFRNGVPLLPRREKAELLTTEFVKSLLDAEDEEWFRENRSGER
jgi:hypothetical protein